MRVAVRAAARVAVAREVGMAEMAVATEAGMAAEEKVAARKAVVTEAAMGEAGTKEVGMEDRRLRRGWRWRRRWWRR